MVKSACYSASKILVTINNICGNQDRLQTTPPTSVKGYAERTRDNCIVIAKGKEGWEEVETGKGGG